jgi:hypothetical protein
MKGVSAYDRWLNKCNYTAPYSSIYEPSKQEMHNEEKN